MGELIGGNEACCLKQCQLLASYCVGGVRSAGIWTIDIRKYLQAKALEYETTADFFVKAELSHGGKLALNTTFVFELGMKWVSVGADCITLLQKEYDSLQDKLYPGGRERYRVVFLGINGDENVDFTEKWEKESQEVRSQIETLKAAIKASLTAKVAAAEVLE